jgi:hypothetical protein
MQQQCKIVLHRSHNLDICASIFGNNIIACPNSEI